ncbi:MAG: pyrroline-5-carboxylate reductase [Pseudomonadota bacterium]
MKISFIGGGNMADALIGGLLRKGFANTDLRAVEIDRVAREKLQQKYGVVCAERIGAVSDDEIILFAVKPQQMREVAQGLELTVNANLVISIAAGIALASLSRWLGAHRRLIRAMPNMPALIGEGVSGLCALDNGVVTEEDRNRAETILRAVGSIVWIENEAQMDVVTAVSGSGPAYVFYFIEAVEDAARGLGMSMETARKLTLDTFSGATRLAAASVDPVAVLRERVTSKGGTTEAAFASMATDHVKEAIIRAIFAANERGRELGERQDKD